MTPNMKSDTLSTHDKALSINLDNTKYGTLAEIGAGQETSRWFFRVGGAAGTVAKSMSAYDMKFSDEIYGSCDRYVSRRRLFTMLDHEYQLLIERLSQPRGENTHFFAFSNTVVAKSYQRNNECHGWLGIRFQTKPNEDHNDIIIHVRMLDRSNLEQQEALGIVGVNLIYGAFNHFDNPKNLITSLNDNLGNDRIEIDMIKFEGPAFEKIDNRVMSLHLVEFGLTESTMFSPSGEVLQPSEIMYHRPILLQRGRFRPVTQINNLMMKHAEKEFLADISAERKPIQIMEITMKNLLSSRQGEIDHQDFLSRVDLLGAIGKTVLISNFAEFHRIGTYLSRSSKDKIGLVLGIPLLKEILDEKYYTDLEGGILESFGRLFKNQLKLYVYPIIDPSSRKITDIHNLEIPPKLTHLYRYLIENQFIKTIPTPSPAPADFSSRSVIEQLHTKNPAWESSVNDIVAATIKEKHFFGYTD